MNFGKVCFIYFGNFKNVDLSIIKIRMNETEVIIMIMKSRLCKNCFVLGEAKYESVSHEFNKELEWLNRKYRFKFECAKLPFLF